MTSTFYFTNALKSVRKQVKKTESKPFGETIEKLTCLMGLVVSACGSHSKSPSPWLLLIISSGDPARQILE